jgi:hypothetical protein
MSAGSARRDLHADLRLLPSGAEGIRTRLGNIDKRNPATRSSAPRTRSSGRLLA